MLRNMLIEDQRGSSASMTVTLSPDTIEESFLPNGGYTSDFVVPSVSGGTSAYTYLWARTGGSTAISLGLAPSTKDMSFYASGTNKRYLANFSCTVTDSAGTPNVATAYITIALGFNVSAYPDG